MLSVSYYFHFCSVICDLNEQNLRLRWDEDAVKICWSHKNIMLFLSKETDCNHNDLTFVGEVGGSSQQTPKCFKKMTNYM